MKREQVAVDPSFDELLDVQLEAERITHNANALVYIGPSMNTFGRVGRLALKLWIGAGVKTAEAFGIDTSGL